MVDDGETTGGREQVSKRERVTKVGDRKGEIMGDRTEVGRGGLRARHVAGGHHQGRA